jgi:hypothetical protein
MLLAHAPAPDECPRHPPAHTGAAAAAVSAEAWAAALYAPSTMSCQEGQDRRGKDLFMLPAGNSSPAQCMQLCRLIPTCEFIIHDPSAGRCYLKGWPGENGADEPGTTTTCTKEGRRTGLAFATPVATRVPALLTGQPGVMSAACCCCN